MPKEFTHFYLADQMAQAAPVKVKELINKYKHIYYTGSIAPDTSYYYLAGTEKKLFKERANDLHGRNRKNTFQIIYDLFNEYDKNLPPWAWAFILGVIAHILSDGVFHPFVYYYTGQIDVPDKEASRKASMRHFIFESWMDRELMASHKVDNQGRFIRSLKKLEVSKGEYHTLFTRYLFPGQEELKKEVIRALKQHSGIQRFFFSRTAYTLARFINFLSGGKFNNEVYLFYAAPGRAPFPSLTAPVDYQIPVTGEACRKSVTDLIREASVRGRDVFGQLEKAIFTPGTPVPEMEGPNLDTGLPSTAPDQEMKHFHILPLEQI